MKDVNEIQNPTRKVALICVGYHHLAVPSHLVGQAMQVFAHSTLLERDYSDDEVDWKFSDDEITIQLLDNLTVKEEEKEKKTEEDLPF